MTKNAPTGAIHRLFGLRVQELRKKRNLTQEELAYLVGVDRSYMGFIERGERNITLRRIAKIAQILGVEASDLLSSN